LETPGWSTVEFDESAWQPVISAEPPSGVLFSQILPAAKVVRTFEPVKILNPADGTYVFDFGQNMSGWTKLRVKGPRGTKVQLRYSPRVDQDGRLETRPNRRASQTDTYILAGKGVEQWRPRFSLHGFRFVEVTGFPGEPSKESLEAEFVRNDLDLAGDFACSNRLINQIHHNALWTFLCSLQGIPQDAAEREERVAWLGDTGFVWEDYIYNIDMAAFTAKWLRDIRDTQRTTGELSVTAPKWWRTGRTGQAYSPFPCWISTYPLLSWYAYYYYGDTRVLEEHYESLQKMVAYKAQHAPGHIFTHGLGDHMEPQEGGVSRFRPTQTSPLLTSTAYYYYDVWLLACMAKILGHDEDARHYFELADEIKAAFNEEFFDKSAGYYGTGTQTANALALFYGMVPESRREGVVKHLAHDITVNHKGHLSTGIIGTNALEQTMAPHGLAEIMFGIATQTTPPSWGYQVRQGATTVWETWEGEINHCMNMKMLGSSEVFFYKHLAGIAPAASTFKKIAINPYVVGDLRWVKALHNTIRGPVAVHWRKNDRSLAMDVTIPANTTATVSVPTLGLKEVVVAESGKVIWKDGSFVDGAAGVTAGSRTPDYVTFDVGSGDYSFRLTGK
jgi:alpha-L-rhamnosidase